ncbi:MAG TPA: antibiotic biosynthesis monooxygenase [Pyrinomonadaceae bacterium]
MPFISLTRLRVRSWRYMPQFVWHSFKTGRQAERAGGFIGGRLLRERRNAFWTVTVWEDEAAMRAYRNAGAHREAMPRLLDWCDEASVAHWTQDTSEIPGWQELHRRMVDEGRPSKVRHPSPAQESKQIAPPKPGRVEQVLKPPRVAKTGEAH